MKKNRFNKGFFIAVIALISILLAACGSDTKTDNAFTGEDIEIEATGKDFGNGTGNDGAPEEGLSVEHEAKIIRNVTINGETKDFDTAAEALKKQVSEAGGYVENSDINGGESLKEDYRSARYANYTIRIPADKLDDFLNKTESLLNVTSYSENTTDVTLDYYDIQSRLETLQSKKAALEAMLEKAETLDDIIIIQNNLYDVIAEIEAYQSKLNLYDSKVNYSTVELRIEEVVEYTVIDDEEPGFGERISEAFKESWSNFGEFCQDFVVFLVYAMPVLLIPAIIVIIIIIAIVIGKRKKKKLKEKNEEE